jgi:hypothetical protein
VGWHLCSWDCISESIDAPNDAIRCQRVRDDTYQASKCYHKPIGKLSIIYLKEHPVDSMPSTCFPVK